MHTSLYLYTGVHNYYVLATVSFCFLTVAIPYRGRLLGSGSGPILYAYLDCTGNETLLSQCATLQSIPFGIGHVSDAGVRCLNASKYSMMEFQDLVLLQRVTVFGN